MLKHFFLIKIIIITSSVYLFNTFASPQLSNYIKSNNKIEALSTLLFTFGGAFVGLSILAFSLTMVAMQLTIDKLPNELFRRFNDDKQLKVFFLFMFIISFCFGLLTIIINETNIDIIITSILGLTIFMLLVIFSTYKRAAELINPRLQLKILTNDLNSHTKKFNKNYQRVLPLYEEEEAKEYQYLPPALDYREPDFLKIEYIKQNSYIIEIYKTYIEHFISIAETYAKTKDYRISAEALNCIVYTNQLYISIKGRTFFNESFNTFNFHKLESKDSFINFSLEKNRIFLSIALKNKDEPLVENILKTIATLAENYIEIDYTNYNESKKTHSVLACLYFMSGIENALNARLIDVVIKGVTLITSVILKMTKTSSSNGATILIPRIVELVRKSLLSDETDPIASIFIPNYLSLLTTTILSESIDRELFFRYSNNALTPMLIEILELKDDIFSTKQKSILNPYFFHEQNSLLDFLTKTTNQILLNEKNEKDANILFSIYLWADSQRETKINLLEVALTKKSAIAQDIIDWNVKIASCLMHLTTSKSTNNYLSSKLLYSSKFFIHNLSYLSNENFLYDLHDYKLYEKFVELSVLAYNLKIGKNYYDIFISSIIRSLKVLLETESNNLFIEDFLISLAAILSIEQNSKLEEVVKFLKENKEEINKREPCYALKDIEDAIIGTYINDNSYTSKLFQELDKALSINVLKKFKEALI